MDKAEFISDKNNISVRGSPRITIMILASEITRMHT
jgi:hypothetical protein